MKIETSQKFIRMNIVCRIVLLRNNSIMIEVFIVRWQTEYYKECAKKLEIEFRNVRIHFCIIIVIRSKVPLSYQNSVFHVTYKNVHKLISVEYESYVNTFISSFMI